MPKPINKQDYAIYWDDVTSAYKGKHHTWDFAFEDLTLGIHKDEFVCILGPSGCGKTTLLKTIIGTKNYEGNIYLDGEPIESIPVKDRGISYISQTGNLYPNLTIFDNLIFPLRATGVDYEEAKARVNDVAKEFGLTLFLTRKPRHISMGQQQKVMMAKSTLHYSRYYLFDEPFSGLGPDSRKEMWDFLKSFRAKQGGTFLMVTHSGREASYLSDHIILMEKGKIIGNGTAYELASSHDKNISRTFETLTGANYD